MPSKKTKSRKAASAALVSNTHSSTQAQVQKYSEPSGFFPFARYISVLGVHTSLLAFVALILPKAPKTLPGTSDSTQQTSIQGALTANPTLTVAWICAGAIPLQAWWAGLVRKWWIEFPIEGTNAEKRMQSVEQDKGKLVVSESNLSLADPLSRACG